MVTNQPDNEIKRQVSTLSDSETSRASSNETSTTTRPDNATSHKTDKKSVKTFKPIAPMHQRLVITWIAWLVYRLFGMPSLINMVNPTSPDIIGGIVWYGLWLIPAFILTPVVLRGRSPYVLLVGSMLTLVYLGASGVTLFIRVYGSSWFEILIYGLDFVLLLSINIWLFLLLKRLPSMNNVIKKPRNH